MASEDTDWKAILDMALGVFSVGLVIWMTFPSVRLGTVTTVNRLREARRARELWEHEQREMAFEMFMVRAAIEGGNTDGLARRLGVD